MQIDKFLRDDGEIKLNCGMQIRIEGSRLIEKETLCTKLNQVEC